MNALTHLRYGQVVQNATSYNNLLNFYATEMETYFTIIQYDSPADQVFLVKNTMHIYAYVENSADQSNAMIAEVNSSQRDMLLAKGYRLQTIESNPQIENYLYFYNETANQGNTLSQLGDIYVVSP